MCEKVKIIEEIKKQIEILKKDILNKQLILINLLVEVENIDDN